jgi:hypothetical protein
MSPKDYAAMTTEQLATHFVDCAKQLGLGRRFLAVGGVAPPDSPVVLGTPEGDRLTAELRALARASRGRPMASEATALLQDEDPDVRVAAALYLREFAPELAMATWEGGLAGCSGSEVIAARQRARTPPPRRPTLQEMSDEALLARFQDAGERLTAFRFVDWANNKLDMDRRNAVIDELTAIGVETKRRGMLARFVPFLDSPDPAIRHHAASACLRIAPEQAVATLEALEAEGDSDTRATAGWTLSRWRAGECYVDRW